MSNSLDFLGDYHDLLTTGWGTSANGLTQIEIDDWLEAMQTRAADDQLSLTTETYCDRPLHYHGPDDHYFNIGLARLNRPDGSSCPEDPSFFAGDDPTARRKQLKHRLHEEWGDTLATAKHRLRDELRRRKPGWRAHHTVHG